MQNLEPGVETGIVKFFDSRDNKRFGFIKLESGEEIFFHFNDGRVATSEVDGWIHWLRPDEVYRSYLEYPKIGDRLMFERTQGKKGPKASPWTTEKYYKEASDQLWCPCGHHARDHERDAYCVKCDCQQFGEEGEPEQYTEVWFTEPPMGHHGYE